MKKPPTIKLTSVKGLTRDQVAILYVDLIRWSYAEELYSNPEIKRVNNLILSKWKPSGLEYIKNKAWKQIGQ